jgi:LmbE family N-acetylglucosaminyl deacetylase
MKLFFRCVLIAVFASQAPAQKSTHTILAVFAHADDHLFAGPLWAKYARLGTKVQLVIVAEGTGGGRLGEVPGVPSGPKLAHVYDEEARCSCRALGIEPPIILYLGDGELGKIPLPPWANLAHAEEELRRIVAETKPDAIITFGPEGVYGHPEHRLVVAVVSQIVQSGSEGSTSQLLYVGFPKDRISEWHEREPISAIENRYLTIRVPYSEADFTSFEKSLSCFKTQFLPQEMQSIPKEMNKVWGGRIYLRPWFGSQEGDTVFKFFP